MLLAACKSVPTPHDVPEALRQFTDAAQFLKPGFESYEFAALTEPDLTSNYERYVPVLLARAGSDFQKPKGLGAGKYRGIEVRDFASADVTAPWWNAGPPSTHVAGSPVWIDKGDGLHFDREVTVYYAIVDERFHVRTYDLKLLESALTRAGQLREIVRPFEAVAMIPAGADHILCLLPRAKDKPYWSRPLPTQPLVLARCGESKRLLVMHRLALSEQYASCLGSAVASRTDGAWTIDEFPADERPSEIGRMLGFSTLFGLAIML